MDRNTSTGALSQEDAPAACLSESGSGATCIDVHDVQSVSGLAVSPDGGSVYSAAASSDAVAVFDRAGGVAPPPDTTAPQLRITKKPKAKIKTTKAKTKIAVSFASEPGAAFTCKVNRGAFAACSSPFSARVKSGKGKGVKHTISIVATDAAGNSSAPAAITTKVIRKRKKR